MKTIVIDGSQMTERRQAHEYLAERLELPEYYGHNLDALFDCLGDISRPTRLVLYRADLLRLQLGDYADGLLTTFADAAAVNSRLQLLFDGVECAQ